MSTDDRDLLDAYSLAVTRVCEETGPAVISVQVNAPVSGLQDRAGEAGTGSGVIIAPDGYAVTNYHVVRGARSVRVVFSDGETCPAQIAGTDEQTDLALLRMSRGTRRGLRSW